MAANFLWALLVATPGLLWQALEASSAWLQLVQQAAVRGTAGTAPRVGADLTPAGWLADDLKYHESLSLSTQAQAYLDGTATSASKWADTADWEYTFVAAMEKLPPGVSTDDPQRNPHRRGRVDQPRGGGDGDGQRPAATASRGVPDGAVLAVPRRMRPLTSGALLAHRGCRPATDARGSGCSTAGRSGRSISPSQRR